MGRKPCCTEEGLNKGAWTGQEDKLLADYIEVHGQGRWRTLPKKAGLKRCGKSCRLRWLNYLRPDIKRGSITKEEEDLIIRLHKLLGNRWSLIAGRLPGRTDNEIKNYWNTYLSKQVSGSSKMKKPSPRKTPAEMAKNYESNVIRTKAVRCSGIIFSDLPASFTKILPVSNINHSFLPNSEIHEPPPSWNGDADDLSMERILERWNSPLGRSEDEFYRKNGNDLGDVEETISPSVENKGDYLGVELEGGCISCFFDGDVWDSFMP